MESLHLRFLGVLVLTLAAAACGQTDRSRALALVRDRLNDPESARFKDVAVSRPGPVFPDATVCGWVNAKNALGGYAGYREFAVVLQEPPMVVVAAGSDLWHMTPSETTQLWAIRRTCGKSVDDIRRVYEEAGLLPPRQN